MIPIRFARGAAVLVGVLTAFSLDATTGQARERMSLNGPWQHVKVDALDSQPPASGWRPCTVPGYLRGSNYERAWLLREFVVPESMRGRRIKIRFGGVKFHSRVLVNGRPVGGCFGGYRPFEVDATDAVRFDRPNQLAVGLHDWTGVFTPGRVDLTEGLDWSRMRSRPKDKILSPIGGVHNCYGIWDDVTLVAHDSVYVKDLFIKPSVRRQELVVDVTLANEDDDDFGVRLAPSVEEDGRTVLDLPSQIVHVPGNGTARLSIRHHWEKPRLWSPDDPHLYHLRTRLSSGDDLRTRFGFREFWIDGHQFFLNGIKTNLLATSWWPPREPMSRDEIRERWEAVKRMGCVAFRTHTQPWRSVHYDVADELGLLMIIEGAVWNDDSVYRINDPVFWDNYAAHLKAMVDRDKNRPSVIMWSLENEFYGGRLNDDAPAKQDLVRMGRLVKQWDPTRPMFYESDGDPGGVADVIGIHYPHEYPNYTCWPNEASWLAQPQKHAGHHFMNGETEFFWRKNKPLYVGEFLWLPSSDPSWHTVFFGDDAYRDYRLYRNRGKAESWKMQILGYRHHEVAGISPWTVIEGGPLDKTNPLLRAHEYAYQKIAAYCHDYDSRFYGGREITRRLEVFNDVPQASSLDLKWEFAVSDKVVDQGSSQLKLAPGDHQLVNVSLRLPQVPCGTPATWKVTLLRQGKQVFDEIHNYAVFPFPKSTPGRITFALYDPTGKTARVLSQLGIEAVDIAGLESPPKDIYSLVIGEGALDDHQEQELVIGEMPRARRMLTNFVAAGGHVLVLRQADYPRGWFDLSLSDHRSTMTFPFEVGHDLSYDREVGHDLFLGLKKDDFKFWHGDHLVTDREFVRPAVGGYRPWIGSGSSDGLNHTPLVERRIGWGTIVHCQLSLTEKAGIEPAAGRLLLNLLNYVRRSPGTPLLYPHPVRTAVFGGDYDYRARLRELGLQFDELSGGDFPSDLSAYALLICRGDVPNDEEALKHFDRRGGNLLFHRVSPEKVRALRRIFQIEIDPLPYAGSVQRSEHVPAPFGAITREDLYWLGPHEGISWSTTPQAREMVDGLFARVMNEQAALPFEIEQWQLDGQIVQRRGDHVTLATVGSAATDMDFPATDTFLFGVVARGSPCNGAWPVARVLVDGKPIGEVTVSSPSWKTFTTFGTVKKGRHRVAVEYVNDASNAQAGEDRNLCLDRLLVDQDEQISLGFLTSPPAVVVCQRDHSKIVIDQLRWDTERRNARKAARYASSLLTTLGGDFTPRFGVAVECETMQPEPGMPHFTVFDTHVGQATNGTLSRSIRIAHPGRYRLELVAFGTSLDGEYPLIDIRLGQQRLGQVRVDSDGWRTFPLDVVLPAGRHELTLEFTNDASRPGAGDRNVMYDKVVFYRDEGN